MIKSSRIKFISIDLKKSFESLKESDPEMYNRIYRTLKKIEHDAFSGIQIPKKRIPKEYIKKYGIKNLWKHNLNKNWRLLYSVESDSILIISIILEWFNHKNMKKE